MTDDSPASLWEDFIDIFYAPSSVFARRQNGSVFLPMLIVTLLVGGFFFLNSGVMQPVMDAEFDRAVVGVMRGNPKMPPEAIERMREIGGRIQQIAVFVFVPLGMLMVGGVLWAVGKLFDAKQTFNAALVCSAYAFVPRVLESVVNGVQGLILDPAQLDGRFRLSFGPGRFLDPDTTSPVLLALVGRLDLFTLWITVLLAIGLSVTGKIPRSRAAIAAAFVWLAGAIPLVIQAARMR